MIHRTSRAIVLCIACIAIVVGVASRIDGLDHKLFWQDEAFSMLRITGHDEAQLYGAFDGTVRPAGSFLALDRLDPNSTYAATIASLREEPQRGPIYYLAAHAWAERFGDGIRTMRALSALLGIAGIALAFGLGRRLGGGAIGGVVLAALVAISPIECHFSQQIREYVLIADAILASCWSLLAALDRPSFVRWTLYSLTIVLGLYVSPIFVALLLAHAAVASVKLRASTAGRRAIGVSVALAVVVALAAYAPWFARSLPAARAHAGDLAWLHAAYPLRSFVLKWAFNVGAVVFDAEFARPQIGVTLVPILILIVAAALTALRRASDDLPRTLALAVTLCSAVPLVVLDVATHAHFESVTRYQMATWIGIDLLLTVAIAKFLASPAPTVRGVVAAFFAFLIGCGIYSTLADRRYDLWWDNNEHIDERLVARTIDAGKAPPLVLASKEADAAPYALVLAHYLPTDASLLLYEQVVPALPAWTGDVYLFLPTAAARADAGTHFALTGYAIRNVSPALGRAIPDLRAARDAKDADAARPENTLWIRESK